MKDKNVNSNFHFHLCSLIRVRQQHRAGMWSSSQQQHHVFNTKEINTLQSFLFQWGTNRIMASPLPWVILWNANIKVCQFSWYLWILHTGFNCKSQGENTFCMGRLYANPSLCATLHQTAADPGAICVKRVNGRWATTARQCQRGQRAWYGVQSRLTYWEWTVGPTLNPRSHISHTEWVTEGTKEHKKSVFVYNIHQLYPKVDKPDEWGPIIMLFIGGYSSISLIPFCRYLVINQSILTNKKSDLILYMKS